MVLVASVLSFLWWALRGFPVAPNYESVYGSPFPCPDVDEEWDEDTVVSSIEDEDNTVPMPFRRFKVLPLPARLVVMRTEGYTERKIAEGVYTEVEPLFNRDGYYYDRKYREVFFERDGKAYLLNNETLDTFEVEMYMLEPPMHPDGIKALQYILTIRGLVGYEKRRYRNRLYLEMFKLQFRKSRMQSRLEAKRLWAEIAEEIEKAEQMLGKVYSVTQESVEPTPQPIDLAVEA
jgi:hypothetical protein